MANRNFSRLVSIRIPFSAASGTDPFDMMGAGIPTNADGSVLDDLSFAFVNETPYDVRLQGFTAEQIAQNQFVAVKQDKNSWSVLARSDKGPFLSKKPAKVSVQAFTTCGNPIPQGTDFTGCYLELVYGRGG